MTYMHVLGADIEDQGNGLSTIRLSGVLAGFPSDPSDIIEIIIDTVNQLIIGFRYFDPSEVLKGSMLYYYDPTSPHFLRKTQSTTPVTLPSGLDAMQIMEISYANLLYEINVR